MTLQETRKNNNITDRFIDGKIYIYTDGLWMTIKHVPIKKLLKEQYPPVTTEEFVGGLLIKICL